MKRNTVCQQNNSSSRCNPCNCVGYTKNYCNIKITQESFILSWITTALILFPCKLRSKKVLMYVILGVHHYQYILK